ncbi:MAG: exodeoxyribonuclease VII large subunit [Bacilli bacterium]|nr:exodeoxyribonuclease VII large subunit [Bacilli bacterium]
MNKDFYSVSELNNYIKGVFDNDHLLRHIKLEGELLDVKKYPSGHIYFNVIDEKSSISAVLFSFNAAKIKFIPKDGDKVMIEGSVSVYPKSGRYQVYVTDMYPSGEGARLIALMKLKAKLEKEGLFDPKHKREINLFPKAIGLVTARGSAAAADLITNIFRRYPLVTIYTFYSAVQGENAPKELVKALLKAYEYPLDTIIIGRGGGSNEDLNAFNDETLVRTIYRSPVPIIAAVGHEIDFTLVDFVADKRASTPTGASELATIDKREVYESLDNYRYVMKERLTNRIKSIKEKLFYLKNRPFFLNPSSIYNDELNEIKLLKDNLNNAMKLYFSLKIGDLNTRKEKLQALNPSKVLNRGFAMIKAKNGKIIKKVNEINLGEEIETTMSDGKLYANVTRKEKHV